MSNTDTIGDAWDSLAPAWQALRSYIDERAKPFHDGNELALPALCWCGLATR